MGTDAKPRRAFRFLQAVKKRVFGCHLDVDSSNALRAALLTLLLTVGNPGSESLSIVALAKQVRGPHCPQPHCPQSHTAHNCPQSHAAHSKPPLTLLAGSWALAGQLAGQHGGSEPQHLAPHTHQACTLKTWCAGASQAAGVPAGPMERSPTAHPAGAHDPSSPALGGAHVRHTAPLRLRAARASCRQPRGRRGR